MKKPYLMVPVVLLALFLLSGVSYAQQPPQQGGWYCPWWGGQGEGYGMGPGMMYGYGRGLGYGMGPGMMYGYGGGAGYGMRPGMMYGYGRGYSHGYGTLQRYGQQRGKPLTEKQAETLVGNYVRSTNNPNLQVGKMTKPSGKDYYVAEITTKSGSLVDKIEVNEYTGWFRSAYAQ